MNNLLKMEKYQLSHNIFYWCGLIGIFLIGFFTADTYVPEAMGPMGCVKLVQRIRKPQQACCLPGFSLTLPLCLAHLLGSLFFLLQSTSMARMGNVCMFRTCRPLCT